MKEIEMQKYDREEVSDLLDELEGIFQKAAERCEVCDGVGRLA